MAGGASRHVLDIQAVAKRIVLALDRIDGAIPRPTRGWLTARHSYAALPAAEHLVDRERFYIAACCAIDLAVRDCRTSRQRRLAERQAVLTTMEDFGLITRTRGRTPQGASKPEGVS